MGVDQIIMRPVDKTDEARIPAFAGEKAALVMINETGATSSKFLLTTVTFDSASLALTVRKKEHFFRLASTKIN